MFSQMSGNLRDGMGLCPFYRWGHSDLKRAGVTLRSYTELVIKAEAQASCLGVQRSLLSLLHPFFVLDFHWHLVVALPLL